MTNSSDPRAVVAALPARWRALFDQALADADGSKTVVAEQMGVSRTLVSLVAAGKYHGNTEAFARRVLLRYDRRDCPHTGEEIAADLCRRRALGPQPYGGQAKLAQWTACQSCLHKPTEIKP